MNLYIFFFFTSPFLLLGLSASCGPTTVPTPIVNTVHCTSTRREYDIKYYYNNDNTVKRVQTS